MAGLNVCVKTSLLNLHYNHSHAHAGEIIVPATVIQLKQDDARADTCMLMVSGVAGRVLLM